MVPVKRMVFEYHLNSERHRVIAAPSLRPVLAFAKSVPVVDGGLAHRWSQEPLQDISPILMMRIGYLLSWFVTTMQSGPDEIVLYLGAIDDRPVVKPEIIRRLAERDDTPCRCGGLTLSCDLKVGDVVRLDLNRQPDLWTVGPIEEITNGNVTMRVSVAGPGWTREAIGTKRQGPVSMFRHAFVCIADPVATSNPNGLSASVSATLGERWYVDDGEGGCRTCGEPYTYHSAVMHTEPREFRCRTQPQPHGDRRDHRAASAPFVLLFKIADAEMMTRMGFQVTERHRHEVTSFRVTVSSAMPGVYVQRATTNVLGEPVWDEPEAGDFILRDTNILAVLIPALINGVADRAKTSHTPNHTPVYDLGTLALPAIAKKP